jgi:hypothetical protein
MARAVRQRPVNEFLFIGWPLVPSPNVFLGFNPFNELSRFAFRIERNTLRTLAIVGVFFGWVVAWFDSVNYHCFPPPLTLIRSSRLFHQRCNQ